MDLHQSDQESPRVWAPIHAIQLLGQLEAAEAVEPLLPYFDWDDDWLAMVLPEAFALIGEPALGPMRALLSDRTREDLIRGRAAEALGRMGQDHPDLRDQVVEALVEQLDQSDRHNDEEAVVNGFIISELVDLKAREAVPAIRRAFIDDRVDTMIIDPPFVEEELGLLQGTVDVG
jgi:HEAT repeat protein